MARRYIGLLFLFCVVCCGNRWYRFDAGSPRRRCRINGVVNCPLFRRVHGWSRRRASRPAAGRCVDRWRRSGRRNGRTRCRCRPACQARIDGLISWRGRRCAQRCFSWSRRVFRWRGRWCANGWCGDLCRRRWGARDDLARRRRGVRRQRCPAGSREWIGRWRNVAHVSKCSVRRQKPRPRPNGHGNANGVRGARDPVARARRRRYRSGIPRHASTRRPRRRPGRHR